MSSTNIDNKATHTARVVFLNSLYPCLSETFIFDQFDALKKEGIVFDVVSNNVPQEDQVHPRMRASLDDVNYLKLTPKKDIASALFSLFCTRPLRSLATLKNILLNSSVSESPTPSYNDSLSTRVAHFVGAAVLIKRYENQHVHFHVNFTYGAASIALLISQLSELSYSISLHGSDLLFDNPPFLVEKLAAAKSIVSISEHNLNYIEQRYKSLATIPKKVISLGVFLEAGNVKQDMTRNKQFTCLHVGRLDVHKAQHILIQSIGSLVEAGYNVHCDIVGDGPLKNDLEDLIKAQKLDSNIQLLGPRFHHEVLEMLPNYDSFLMSSVVEGMPIAIMEAMRAKVPIISTNVGAIDELLDHGRCGSLVEANDSDALAEALKHQINHAEEANDGAACALNYLRDNFDLRANSLKLAEHLQTHLNAGVTH